MYVDVARLIPIDAVSGARAEPTDKISLKPHDLLYSLPSDFEVVVNNVFPCAIQIPIEATNGLRGQHSARYRLDCRARSHPGSYAPSMLAGDRVTQLVSA